jgi:hypothetical protein
MFQTGQDLAAMSQTGNDINFAHNCWSIGLLANA